MTETDLTHIDTTQIGKTQRDLAQKDLAQKDMGAAADLIDVTMKNFRDDVIQESMRRPVLVDFWAPWCNPCKQLTPILEKAVRDCRGKARLAKMNIDQHPQVAEQLGIQSIPAVVAFQGGQMVDGFVGVLPESEIKAFIERLAGKDGADEIEAAFAEAQSLLDSGEGEAAAPVFSAIVEADAAHAGARAGLARVLIARGDLEAAKALIGAAPANQKEPAALAAARAELALAEQAGDVGDLAPLMKRLEQDPGDAQARHDLAVALNAAGKREEAAAHLLDLIKRDRDWNDGAARKLLLQFFESWGPADPATLAARRRLSSLLFS